MSQVVLAVGLGLSLVAAAWLYAYKVRHPYTKDDLVKARRDSVDKSRSVVSGKVQEAAGGCRPLLLRRGSLPSRCFVVVEPGLAHSPHPLSAVKRAPHTLAAILAPLRNIEPASGAFKT